MTRRQAIALFPAPFAPGAELLKPKALKPGDTVGLVTPATSVFDPDRIALAERTIAYFDLKLRIGRNVRKRSGYMGATIEERAADMNDMFRDPDVKAIFALRGGYGSAQILNLLDYGLIRRNPKIFLGFSDITAMHLALQQRAGLVTFHGPAMLSRFTSYTRDHFRTALFEAKPLGTLTNPPETDKLRPGHALRTLRPGQARGRLTGGNLTLISTTMGTPFEIDTRGRILLLEDAGEQPYSIDRMLTQLRLAGKLQAAAGIVFGECADCRPRDFQPSLDPPHSLGEVLDETLGKLNIPVLSGLTFGHTGDQLTLPLGVMTLLDADKGHLILEESGLS